MKHCKGDNLS